MRGVNLAVFDFDYDLTWSALFLNAEQQVYGRFGGRDASSAEKYLTLPGLRYAMRQALAAHARQAPLPGAPVEKRTVADYPGYQRFHARDCVHCHHAYDLRNEAAQGAQTWRLDDAWVYPFPENVGLSLDPDQGNRVVAVAPDSPAARVGVQPGDELESVNRRPAASYADVQHALHRAPAEGFVPVTWRRGGQDYSGSLRLGKGWRVTDLSWRPSTRRLGPSPLVHGDDVPAGERAKLGLAPRQLALRLENFVSREARTAGFERGDIVLGLNGQNLEMTARQFEVHVRLHYKSGDRVVYNLLRAGKRHDLEVRLPDRKPF